MAHRFGKHPAKRDYRTLRFKNYVKAGAAAPPASYDVLSHMKPAGGSPTKLFPMDGNDTYGDCTIAAVAHADTVYHGLVGKKHVMTEKSVEKVYFHLSGGIDSGLIELDVLNYWRQQGIGGNKIMAYVSVDRKNQSNIKQAIHLFGGVYLGFQVQQNCEKEFDEGKPWTPGRLTKHGHAVFAVGYDSKELTVLTWGNTQKATWDWWDECVDEAYAILPSEAKEKSFASVDLTELKKDLQDVATEA